MRKTAALFMFTALMFNVINLNAQKLIIDRNELPSNLPGKWIADAEGLVLADMTILRTSKQVIQKGKDDIVTYPNWPVHEIGKSERGGVCGNMDGDDELEIIYCVGQSVYAWNYDGSDVEGWPVTVSLYPDGAPAFGDIDGDGEEDVVVSVRSGTTGNEGKLYAFHKDGTVVSGFPVTLAGGATKTPVLSDLDSDGDLEIIIEERDWPDGYVGIYQGDGSTMNGWPQQMDYIPASSVAVGDIDNDGEPEIIGESYYSVYAFEVDGTVIPGFPFTPGNDRVFSYSSPVLADLDEDGYREIICGDHSLSAGNGQVHVLNHDGTALSGWPKTTGNWIYGPPAVGDIDNDGHLDVVVGDQVLSPSPTDYLYGWDRNGNNLPGFPIGPLNAINNQVLLADLDGDGYLELMIDDNTGGGDYLGYNHDGTPMANWPLAVNGSTFFMNPLATDINLDGVLDLSGGGREIQAGDCYIYLWDAGVSYDHDMAILPVLQYNVRHTGVYGETDGGLSAAFSADQTVICQGALVQFSDLSTGNVTSWNWQFPGGTPSSSTQQNPQISYTDPGNYDVTLTVSDGNNSNTVTLENFIGVFSYPQVPVTPAGPEQVYTEMDSVTHYTTTSSNAVTFEWELLPANAGSLMNNNFSDSTEIHWNTQFAGVAELRAKAINPCGESDLSAPLMIYVNTGTGLTRSGLTMIKVSPNPGDGFFTFSIPLYENAVWLSVFDHSGRPVLERQLLSDNYLVDLSHLDNGIYFYLLKTKDWTQSGKLIKMD